MDYWYVTSGGMFSRKDMPRPQTAEGDETLQNDRQQRKVMKCFIVRCHEPKALFAHCVTCEGADEEKYVASLVTSDVAFMTLVRAALQEIRCHVPDVTHATSDEAAA